MHFKCKESLSLSYIESVIGSSQTLPTGPNLNSDTTQHVHLSIFISPLPGSCFRPIRKDLLVVPGRQPTVSHWKAFAHVIFLIKTPHPPTPFWLLGKSEKRFKHIEWWMELDELFISPHLLPSGWLWLVPFFAMGGSPHPGIQTQRILRHSLWF